MTATSRSSRDTPKGAARRALILDHATTILVERGYAALSLRAVASAAGISLGNLQYYYTTRASLVGALLDRHLASFLSDRETMLRPPVDLDVALDAILTDDCDQATATLFLEIWAMSRHDETVAATVREFYDQYARLVASVLTPDPDGREEGVSTRATAVMTLLEGSTLLRTGLIADPDGASLALLRNLALRLASG